MSLIAEYRDTEAAIAELKQRLEQLGSDDRLQKEMQFEEKLRALMGEYGKSLRDIENLLNPQKAAAPAQRKARNPRKMKVYRNPNDDTVIETKGGNHKILKQWKEKYGAETVESWLQQ